MYQNMRHDTLYTNQVLRILGKVIVTQCVKTIHERDFAIKINSATVIFSFFKAVFSLHASATNVAASCSIEGRDNCWLALQAWMEAQRSFVSRNFSPLTRMRGPYCKTTLLHCLRNGQKAFTF